MKMKNVCMIPPGIDLRTKKTASRAQQYESSKVFMTVSTPGRPTIWLK